MCHNATDDSWLLCTVANSYGSLCSRHYLSLCMVKCPNELGPAEYAPLLNGPSLFWFMDWIIQMYAHWISIRLSLHRMKQSQRALCFPGNRNRVFRPTKFGLEMKRCWPGSAEGCLLWLWRRNAWKSRLTKWNGTVPIESSSVQARITIFCLHIAYCLHQI